MKCSECGHTNLGQREQACERCGLEFDAYEYALEMAKLGPEDHGRYTGDKKPGDYDRE